MGLWGGSGGRSRLGLASHGKEVSIVETVTGKGFAAGCGHALGSDGCSGLQGAGWK